MSPECHSTKTETRKNKTLLCKNNERRLDSNPGAKRKEGSAFATTPRHWHVHGSCETLYHPVLLQARFRLHRGTTFSHSPCIEFCARFSVVLLAQAKYRQKLFGNVWRGSWPFVSCNFRSYCQTSVRHLTVPNYNLTISHKKWKARSVWTYSVVLVFPISSCQWNINFPSPLHSRTLRIRRMQWARRR